MTFRVLHAAHMRTPMVGVVRQMEYEQVAADELGIAWHSRMFCCGYEDSAVTVNAPEGVGYLQFKQSYYHWLREQVSNYDVVMLRYAKNDIFQYLFVRSCEIPVISMHHTMEVYELIGNGNIKSRVLAQVEKWTGKLTLGRVSAIAAVTNEIGAHQRARCGNPNKTVIHYGNGAVYGEKPLLTKSIFTSGFHEFIYLSSAFPVWMGLDLLFSAAQQCNSHFNVHIVGKLSKEQEVMLQTDSRFIAHGYMDTVDVDNLMAKCTVGLSTFAIHRKRFTEGNTLKAREYLRAGLPVYAGHRDIFNKNFPYHCDGPADFVAILAFADKMLGVSREAVSEAARPLIEKKRVLDAMYTNLKDLQV